MKVLATLRTWVHFLFPSCTPQDTAAKSDTLDRGDVPGWVMITMMTAILVAALTVVARESLVTMFNSAMTLIEQ